MVYKRFGFQLTLRVAFLLLTLSLLAYILVNTSLILSIVLLIGVVAAQLVELIQYLRRANMQMTRFLSALVHNDFSYRPAQRNEGASWQELYQACDTIMQKMNQLRTAQEEKHLFLQVLTEQAGVGLITFTENGDIALFNAEAKRLLGIPHLRHIQALNRLGEDLGEKLLHLGPGESTLFKLVRESGLVQLAVRATHFRTSDGRYTLLSLQHIGAELDEQEYMAWQKLISVLTHEVMNSITPIISLAGTSRMLLGQYAEAAGIDGDSELYEDLEGAMETIESRSRGMFVFVNAYRKLNKVPVPEIQEVHVRDLFRHIGRLEDSRLKENNIQLSAEVFPESLNTYADPDLLEQVLINLVINAADAMPADMEGKKITLKAWQDGNWNTMISVTDNGSGIPPQFYDRIFIPFFSTKPHGSGIGLSICKQILRAHGGDITLMPAKPNETTFLLRLNKV